MTTCDGCANDIPRGEDGYHREALPGIGMEYVFYCTAIDVPASQPDDTDEEFPF